MNRTLIITLFLLTNIAAPMMAMDESDPKITALLLQPIHTLDDDYPISEEDLLAKNPSWQTARSWSQEDKNKLLSGAMNLRRFSDTDTRIPLAVAIGADPNYEDGRSKHTPWTTPLTRAARFSKYWLVQYLLEKNADPNQITRFFLPERCPLQCATTTKMAELLTTKGAIIPKAILHTLGTDTCEDLMGFYLKMGVRPEQDESGATPLHIITPFWTTWMERRLCKAQVLIKAGVDLCAQTKDGGNTALHCAALGKDVVRKAYIQAEPLDISDQICSAIINGCKERHQGYQERLALLCCLNRICKPLYGQRSLCKARFGWKSQDTISPFQLLSIENGAGQIPYQLWPENEELNPANYAPVQDAKRNETQPLLENK